MLCPKGCGPSRTLMYEIGWMHSLLTSCSCARPSWQSCITELSFFLSVHVETNWNSLSLGRRMHLLVASCRSISPQRGNMASLSLGATDLAARPGAWTCLLY